MRRKISIFLAILITLSSITVLPIYAEEYSTREYAINEFITASKSNLEKGESDLTVFSDYDSITTDYRYSIAIAVGNSIVKGYDDNTLRPKDTIKRIEALVILSRCLGDEHFDGNIMEFNDVPEWAKSDIDKLSSAGIVQGYGDGRLGSDDLLTVDQISILTERIVSNSVPTKVLTVETLFNTEYSKLGYEALDKANKPDMAKKIYSVYNDVCERMAQGETFAYEESDDADTVFINIPFQELGTAYSENEMEQFISDFTNAFMLFRVDHPQYYWLAPQMSYDNGNIVMEINKPYQNVEERASTNETLVSKLNEYITEINKCTSNYEKIKLLNEKLCKETRYAYESDGSVSHNRWSNSINGILNGTFVCEGYSKFAQTVLKFCDVDCVMILGLGGVLENNGGHAWNAVKLDDGRYYYLDITWNTKTHQPKYQIDTDWNKDDKGYVLTYLASGAEDSINVAGELTTFGESHKAYFITPGIDILSYFDVEEVSKTRYTNAKKDLARDFVRRCYIAALTTVDDTECEYYAEEIASGRMTEAEFANFCLTEIIKYVSDTDFINSAYKMLFGRMPKESELREAKDSFNNGSTRDDLIYKMVRDNEFMLMSLYF